MDIINFKNFYKGKRVFITGHTGFKGSWLCLMLHQFEAEVYGYALNPPTTPSLFEEANVADTMTSFIGDIRDYKNLADTLEKVQPEIVIHMAAQPLVRESYLNPIETYEVNIMGTVNLLDTCRKVSSIKAIVNVTTDKCYENREWHWGYRENEPMGGYDPYSSSKACSELVTASFRNSFFNPKEYEKHGVALASARAGNVIGGGDWANDRLIPDFIRAINRGESVIIRSPFAIRPWQHVLEPLTGYLVLAKNLVENGIEFADAWNFGPEDNDAKNVQYIIEKICELWGNDATFELEKNPQPHEAHYLKLDCTKANTLLNWHPVWNVDTTLEKIVAFMQNYNAKKDMQDFCNQQIEEYYTDLYKIL